MLGVVTCLGAEVTTNVGIQEQIAKAPFAILGTFVLISLASYIPIFRYILVVVSCCCQKPNAYSVVDHLSQMTWQQLIDACSKSWLGQVRLPCKF